jgi:hypothetical protein
MRICTGSPGPNWPKKKVMKDTMSKSTGVHSNRRAI